MERETSKTFRETGGRWTVASYLEYELRFTKERYPHLRCLLNLYLSRSCSLFSLEKRRRGGGRRDRLHDKHTHTHTRARYSVSLCFFSPPPLLFFPSSFFFHESREGETYPLVSFPRSNTNSRNIRFANKSQQGITWKGTILARVSETRLLVRFVVGQQREKCTLTVGWHFWNFSPLLSSPLLPKLV